MDDYSAQRPRSRRRRSSITQDPFEAPADWNATSLYSSRPPPSSFPSFPFQSYPGNPDPGTPIPGISSRRSSLEYLSQETSQRQSFDASPPSAPFMSQSDQGHSSNGPSSPNPVYRNSFGHPLSSASTSNLPSASTRSFRAPFLSPASRPSSGLWSPPSYVDPSNLSSTNSPSVSSTALPSAKRPLPSTRLAKPLTRSDKPWLSGRRGIATSERSRSSYFLTLFCLFLGIAGAAALCFFETRPNKIHRLADSDLCLILNDQFNNGDLDTSVWKRDVGLGGFGNGEFQVMTSSSDNAKIINNQLYIIPTLTSERIGTDKIFNGYDYKLDDCTTPGNKSACQVSSRSNTSTVIPPVESARLTTNGTKTLRYGRVEVRAKLPQGDWLWPAIWLMPQESKYGQWPLSGEIDVRLLRLPSLGPTPSLTITCSQIMESRGNSPSYPFEGVDYVRSSLNYGPLASLLTQLTSSVPIKRAKAGFAETFHTYTLEWSDKFMRMYIDSRLHASLDISTSKEKESFWTRGGYPSTAANGTNNSPVVVQNIWEQNGGGWNAPYDQEFYLIISLSAGGTSGWFPDNLGGKPWADGSDRAMTDFAKAQDDWSKTWPGEDDRAFRM
ncbi:hypothetical protein V5O48_007336 [Marasmius crinis-equi]|uniref:GH16 domain-containing protein n=1 Tax=Marasmius crinis-equi TaxID=585013 RepID=A0ABR3FH75_9AGAR